MRINYFYLSKCFFIKNYKFNRSKVIFAINIQLFTLLFRHYKIQQQNPHAIWKLPDSNVVNNTANPSEVIVGGVYLRLFISNPGWTLRKPKEFLAELMDTLLGLRTKPENEVCKSLYF